MLDTILSRCPATKHIQLALAGALFRLGLGANGTTILSVATGLIAGFAFGRASTIAGVLLLGTSALLDAVDGTIHVLEGQRRVIFVTGEVGIGKTTFVRCPESIDNRAYGRHKLRSCGG
jgi:hypothetical protein